MVAAALALGSAIGGQALFQTDFRTIYDSAVALRTGGVLAEAPDRPLNLNAPSMSLVIAPLTWFPFITAFVVWTLVGVACVALSLRDVSRRAHLGANQTIWTLIVLAGSMPCAMVWVQGQVTWLLLAFITRAWAARSMPLVSGAWLGAAIALKPHLALMALVVPWRIGRVAAAIAVLLTVAAVAFTGVQPWVDWLDLSNDVTWLSWPMNLSFLGTVARLKSQAVAGPTLNELPLIGLTGAAAAALLLWWRSLKADDDTRWLCAAIWTVFASPLGWIYYTPLALPPLLAGWRRLYTLPVLVLSIPLPLFGLLVPSAGLSLTAGTLYTSALLFLWWAAVRKKPVLGYHDAGLGG